MFIEYSLQEFSIGRDLSFVSRQRQAGKRYQRYNFSFTFGVGKFFVSGFIDECSLYCVRKHDNLSQRCYFIGNCSSLGTPKWTIPIEICRRIVKKARREKNISLNKFSIDYHSCLIGARSNAIS